jgi:hypothetical protein
LHCEQRPRSVEARFKSLRLCDRCASVKGLRIIYRRRKGWTRERDRRIQALVERVKAGLPLFDNNDVPQLRLFTAENAESAEKE